MEVETPTQTVAPTSETVRNSPVETLSPSITGAIHGDVVDAVRIIAGSDFPVGSDALVTFTSDEIPDATEYTVGVSPENINFHPYNDEHVYIRGVLENYHIHEDKFVNRVSYQATRPARFLFQKIHHDLGEERDAFFTKGAAPSWQVIENWTDYILSELINRGIDVTVRLSVLRDLYDPHPDYSLQESGQLIVTDTSVVEGMYDEDKYRVDSSEENIPGGHRIVHYLVDGECPACGKSFTRLSELHGHIGGVLQHADEDDPHHDIDRTPDPSDISHSFIDSPRQMNE